MSDLSQSSDKPNAIIGYGSLGRQIEQLLHQEGGRRVEAYFDDFSKESKSRPFTEFRGLTGSYSFVLGLGYKQLKAKNQILQELHGLGAQLVSVISSSSHIDQSAQIGKGVCIYPMSNIDQNVIIEDGTLVNNSCVISHESRIGECTYLSPGVVLSGQVNVGKRCFLGSGSIVSNGVTIGDDCVLGIGSVVTKDLKAGTHAIGNPLRVLDNKIELI